MKLQKKLVGLLLGTVLAIGGVVTPVPGQDVASAAWTQSRADKVIAVGRKYLGTPYKFGSSTTTTRTFDCSSFTKRVYDEALDIYLPRVSRDQAKRGYRVSKSYLRKGDLVFFRSSSASSTSTYITHVAIYAGDNKILHTYGSPGVTFSTFRGTNWEKRFVTARRVL